MSILHWKIRSGKLIKQMEYGKLCWSVDNKSVYREFKNSDDCKEWGMGVYKEWGYQYKKTMQTAEYLLKDRVSSLVYAPIECYCGYKYQGINELLRRNGKIGHNTDSEMIILLSTIMISAPRVPCDLILYRLVCDEFIKEMINKNRSEFPTPIREKGFMSTSLLKNIVNEQESYASHKNLLKIYVDKGSIGIYVNAVTTRSEEEMLLFPNGYLAMVEYPYIDNDSKKTVYECKLINFNIDS